MKEHNCNPTHLIPQPSPILRGRKRDIEREKESEREIERENRELEPLNLYSVQSDKSKAAQSLPFQSYGSQKM